MKKFTRRVLLFIFFISTFFIAFYFGYYIKTNPNSLLTKYLDEEQAGLEKRYIIPGGQTIGVELKTEGVLVVGLADIVDKDKVSTSPAKLAGIEIGDKILGIDSKNVEDSDDIISYTEESGIKQYNLTVERDGTIQNFLITPVQIYKSEDIKFGFWARDDIAGIGTITFIEPESGNYSAIGHGISDTDTGELIDIESGTISKANITNIKLGKKGEPGEIIGYIMKDDEDDNLGNVEKNTEFGIFGSINEKSLKFFNSDLIEVGSKDEIKIGPAQIYSCVNNEIKIYDVEITKLFFQNKPDEKSFVIKIVDEELLNLTNGIIQGMSGCPVIQDNKIVGAVTHVFMNNPTKGYGIYIEWILNEIDSDNKSEL